MKNQKSKYLMIGIAVSVCLVLFGLGGYYIGKQNKPSSSPISTATANVTATVTYTTDNWQTYTNTKSGFSLKYPGDYFTYQGDPALGFILTTSAPEGGKGPKFLGENDARLGASSADFSFQTLDEYLDNQQSLFKNIQKNISKKSVIIGGISGYKITYSFQTKPEGTSSTTIYASDGMVIKNGKRYSVSLSSFNQKLLDSKQIMFDQILSSFKFITPATTDTSSWTLYTNKTFGYSIKFPATYVVPPQTAKHISQVGLDNNIAVIKKSDSSGGMAIVIDVSMDKDNLSLGGYMDKKMKMLGIDGPLQGGMFNGVYDSVFNKNQPGANVFVKQGQYVYHIVAPTASTDKEIEDIVATFRFTK